ncbi:hypothetical protein QFZ69_004686 [Arthrobacter sp. V1I7]|nr:hypothetical protein [Arthrobacter sp. V1I7]
MDGTGCAPDTDHGTDNRGRKTRCPGPDLVRSHRRHVLQRPAGHGLMRELQAAAVTVPDHSSVVRFNNIFGADFTTSALTTIASPFSVCSVAALEQLLAAFPGPGGVSGSVTPLGGIDLEDQLARARIQRPAPRSTDIDADLPPPIGPSLLERVQELHIISPRAARLRRDEHAEPHAATVPGQSHCRPSLVRNRCARTHCP